MKFSLKLFISSILIITLAFAVSSFALISAGFRDAAAQEAEKNIEEHQSLKFVLQSALISADLQGKVVDDPLLTELCAQAAKDSPRSFALLSENGFSVYTNISDDIQIPSEMFSSSDGRGRYVFRARGQSFYCMVSGQLDFGGHTYQLVSMRTSEEVFRQLDEQISLFFWSMLGTVGVSSALLLFTCRLLAKPIHQLTDASCRIAQGAYGQRVEVRSDDEIGQLAENFNAMAQAVEDQIAALELAARQREDFMASFAHELKTPLTSIIGYADLLRSRPVSEQDRLEALSTIVSEGRRLEALSFKLLELFILSKTEFALSPIAMAGLLRTCGDAFAPACREAQLQLCLQAEEAHVSADGDLLRTLIANLLDNARKASSPGGRLWLVGTKADGFYKITVRDEGLGIPAEELPRITEAFYMVDKSRARSQNGAGLGLALCRQIAQIHHGQLQFESAPGRGTAVTLELPLFAGSLQEEDHE
ncbi:MAG: HAMP domain-containing histidine kinase [Christensenellaceae bacterium]|nr:HAMP domain-containing histidine kinase [Christensenellaceae bacterium]